MLAVSFVYIDRYRDVIRVYEERDQAALLHRSTYRTKCDLLELLDGGEVFGGECWQSVLFI